MCMIRSNGKEMGNLQSKASVKSAMLTLTSSEGVDSWAVGMTPSVKHLPWKREGLSLNTKTYIKMVSVVVHNSKPKTGWQRLVVSWVCLTGHNSLAGEVQGSGRHCHQRGRWNSLRKNIWGWLQGPTHKGAHGSVHIDMFACVHSWTKCW